VQDGVLPRDREPEPAAVAAGTGRLRLDEPVEDGAEQIVRHAGAAVGDDHLHARRVRPVRGAEAQRDGRAAVLERVARQVRHDHVEAAGIRPHHQVRRSAPGVCTVVVPRPEGTSPEASWPARPAGWRPYARRDRSIGWVIWHDPACRTGQ